MARLLMFAGARTAAGRGADTVDAGTVGDVLDVARRRYGAEFEAVLATCAVWVNGEPAAHDTAVGPSDEVAVLPPVSGGAA